MRKVSMFAARGAAGQQYAIIVGLVGVVALLAVTSVGGGVKTLMINVGNAITRAENGAIAAGPTSSGSGVTCTAGSADYSTYGYQELPLAGKAGCSFTVDLWGGAGGAGYDNNPSGRTGSEVGGRGGYTRYVFTPPAGTVKLAIQIGQGGGETAIARTAYPDGGSSSTTRSAGGGGSSRLYLESTGGTLLAVAGGGGGAAYNDNAGAGGLGGGYNAAGTAGCSTGGIGTGGCTGGGAFANQAGQAGVSSTGSGTNSGGGGGGGHSGGAAGASVGLGGGGGSGYANTGAAGFISATGLAGARASGGMANDNSYGSPGTDGRVTISWAP